MKDAALILAAVLFPLSGVWASSVWAAVNLRRLDHDREMFDRKADWQLAQEDRIKKERTEFEQQRRSAN